MSNESFFLKPAPKWKRFNARFSPIIGFTFSQNRKRNARHFALLLRMCERECANVCVCVCCSCGFVWMLLFERHWFFGTFSFPIIYDIDSSPASFSVKRFHDQYLSKLKQHRWRRLTDNRERHIAENSQRAHTQERKKHGIEGEDKPPECQSEFKSNWNWKWAHCSWWQSITFFFSVLQSNNCDPGQVRFSSIECNKNQNNNNQQQKLSSEKDRIKEKHRSEWIKNVNQLVSTQSPTPSKLMWMRQSVDDKFHQLEHG